VVTISSRTVTSWAVASIRCVQVCGGGELVVERSWRKFQRPVKGSGGLWVSLGASRFGDGWNLARLWRRVYMMARLKRVAGKAPRKVARLRAYFFPGLPAATLCRSYGAEDRCRDRVAVWMVEASGTREKAKTPPGGRRYERLGTRQEKQLGRGVRRAFVFVAACCLRHRQDCLCY
jgi:hypothetical protein